MTLSEIEVQLQCAGYSQKEIEAMCIVLVSSACGLREMKRLILLSDIFIVKDKILKDKTGYLKGEFLKDSTGYLDVPYE